MQTSTLPRTLLVSVAVVLVGLVLLRAIWNPPAELAQFSAMDLPLMPPAAEPAQVSVDEELRAEVRALTAQVQLLFEKVESISLRAGQSSGDRTPATLVAESPTALNAKELEALRELGGASEILLHLASQAEPEYAWHRKQERIREAAEAVSAEYGVGDPSQVNNELLSLSFQQLRLDNRIERAIAKGLDEAVARQEWTAGWQALQVWMEDRFVKSGVCDASLAATLAADALDRSPQFSE